MKVSVVIPLYNEEENIAVLHQRLKETLDRLGPGYETIMSQRDAKDYENPPFPPLLKGGEGGFSSEIIYVDDGSTDRTLEILEKIQAEDKKVVVLSLRRNFGQTAAFAAGFDFARGDIVITMDGDLQNDPADIPKLLDLIKDNDLVSGWRKKRKDAFITRRLPSMLANWIISRVTGVKLHDYGCSLKAYRREVIKNLKLYGEMHRFIPAVASWYGVRMAEVETTHYPRLRGKSKYGLSRTMKVILDLITVKFLQSFSTKPLQFFGPIGLFSSAAGFLISLYLSIEKIFIGKPIGGRPLLLLGILLIIVGIQLIGMGLLGEMLVRVYHESQRKPIYVIKKIIGAETE